jgi:hypothetical protein
MYSTQHIQESYNGSVTKEVIRIPKKEALATGLMTLLARVRAGAEILIEMDGGSVVVLRSAEPQPGRLLSESIAMAEAHGSTVTLDGNFGRDLD